MVLPDQLLPQLVIHEKYGYDFILLNYGLLDLSFSLRLLE